MFPFNDELVTELTRRLSKAENPDEIIADICLRTGVHWQEAKALVECIQQEKSSEITRHQRPLMTLTALALFLAGLLFSGLGFYTLLESLLTGRPFFPDDLTTYLAPVIERGADPIHSLQPAFLPYARMLLEIAFGPFSAVLVGLMMLLGSLRGMKETWRDLINRWLDSLPRR